MKLGLFKKSLVCVLTATFALTLASCKFASSEEASVSKTNVFKNSDVLAYAKINKKQVDKYNTEITTVDANKYGVYSNYTSFAILREKDNTTKYSMYIKASNKLVDLHNEVGTESFYSAGSTDNIGNKYGYITIMYSSTYKQEIFGFDGELIVPKGNIQNFNVRRKHLLLKQ